MDEHEEINPFSAPQEFAPEPTRSSVARRGPEGIGGWLILVVIGLSLSPIVIAFGVITTHVPLFTSGQFSTLMDPASSNYHPLLGPLVVMEVIGNVIICGLAVTALVQMFRKSRRFPKWAIAFYAGNLGFLLLDAFVASMIPLIQQDADTSQGIIRAVISCAIWIPYMCVSVRVKNTFVQ
jgi:hypothetical protein